MVPAGASVTGSTHCSDSSAIRAALGGACACTGARNATTATTMSGDITRVIMAVSGLHVERVQEQVAGPGLVGRPGRSGCELPDRATASTVALRRHLRRLSSRRAPDRGRPLPARLVRAPGIRSSRRRPCFPFPGTSRPAGRRTAGACGPPSRSTTWDAVIRSGAFPCSTHCSSAASASKTLGPGPPPQCPIPGTMKRR